MSVVLGIGSPHDALAALRGPSDAVQVLVDNRVDCLAIGPFWLIA